MVSLLIPFANIGPLVEIVVRMIGAAIEGIMDSV